MANDFIKYPKINYNGLNMTYTGLDVQYANPNNLTYKTITPTYDINKLSYTAPNITYPTITALPPLSLNQQRYVADYARKLNQQNAEWQKLQERALRTVNLNEPTQLNSLADVVGTILGGARFKNESPIARSLYNKFGSNILTNIAAGFYNLFSVSKQFVVDPIVKGEGRTLALNLLQGGTETLDVLANPIKGAILESIKGAKNNGVVGALDGIGIGTGIVKGIGYGERGRTTYEYDTGNKAADFVLELATDPGVWASFGLTGIFKSTASKVGKEAISETAEGVLKEIVSEAGEHSVRQWLSRTSAQVIKTLTAGEDVSIKTITQQLIHTAPIQRGVWHPLTEGLSKEALQKLTPEALVDIAETVLDVSKATVKNLNERTAYTILKSIDTVDNTVAKVVFSPVWGTYKGVEKLYKMHNSRILKTAEPYINTKGTLSILDLDTAMAKTGEVNKSLTSLVEEQGLKGFSNTSVQKAFYSSAKQDINQLQHLVKALNQKAPNFEVYEYSLKQYLTETHTFKDTTSIKGMLEELAEAYKKAGQASDMFKDFYKNLTDIIKTYDNVINFKEHYSIIADNIFSKKVLSELSEKFTPLSKEDVVRLAEKQNISYENAYELLKQKKAFINNTQLTNISEYAQQAYRINKVLNKIFSDTHTKFRPEFVEKLKTNVLQYFKGGMQDEAIADYINLFLPEGSKLDDILYKVYRDEADVIAQYVRNKLLQSVANTFGFKNSTLFKQNYLAPMLNPERIVKTHNNINYTNFQAYFKDTKKTVYDLSQAEAALFFKIEDAKTIARASIQLNTLAEKIAHVWLTGAPSIGETITEALDELTISVNKIYENMTSSLIEHSQAFETYLKEILKQNPQVKSTLENVASLRRPAINTKYSNVETEVAELFKSLNKRYVLKASAPEFKTSVTNITYMIEEAISAYDNTALDSVFSYTQDADIPLIDVLQDTLVYLKNIVQAETIDVHEFIDVINNLDLRLKSIETTLQKDVEQGLDAGPGVLFVNIDFDLPATGLDKIPVEKQDFVLEFLKDYREVFHKGSFGTDAEAEALFRKHFPDDPYSAKYYHDKARQYNKFVTDDVFEHGLLEHTPSIAHSPTTRAINKAYVDVYNKLETIVNNGRALVELKPYEFSTTGNTVVYALKQEQTKSSRVYLDDDAIFNFLNAIDNNNTDVIPKTIIDYSDEAYVSNKLSEATTDAERSRIRDLAAGCTLIQDGASSVLTYGALLNKIENAVELSTELRTALITSLNSPHISKIAVEDVALDPEFLYEVLFKRIEDYVNAIRKSEVHSMDFFRNELAQEEYFEKATGLSSEVWERMAHHSDADVFVNEEYIKRNLADKIQLRSNDIFIDIETSSLNRYRGEVLEISLKTKDSIVTFKRHLDFKKDANARPSNSLLEVYSHGEIDRQALRNTFYDYHNKNYSGPQFADQVSYYESETDLLQAATDYLYRTGVVFKTTEGAIDKLHPEASRLIGHNILDYDIEFLKRRALENGITNFEDVLNRFSQVDTYKLIQEKYNYLKLNSTEKSTIESLLQDYVSLRTLANENGLKHMGEDFINAIPKELSKGLTIVLRNLPENTGLDTTVRRELQNMLSRLKTIRINNIKDVNLVSGSYVFTTDQLLSPEFKEQLISILQKDDYYKDWTDEQLSYYVKYINPTKALYSGWGLYNSIGFKKIFDEKAVRAWFDMPSSIPEQMGRQAYATVKVLNRNLDRIKNPNAILPFEKAIDDFLEAVSSQNLLSLTKTEIIRSEKYTSPGVKEIIETENVLHSDLKNLALQYLIKNTDAISEKYVLAHYIYTLLQHKMYDGSRSVLSFIPSNICADMEEVISNRKLFTHAVVWDSSETFAEHSRHLIDGELWESAAAFKASAEDFKHNIETFELCDKLDESGLFSPEKQAFAQAAYPTFKLLDDYSNLAKEANTTQLYEMESKLFYVSDVLGKQTLHNVLQYESPDDLIKVLAWGCGAATFSYADAPKLFEKLLQDSKILNSAGIVTVFENNRAYLALDTNKFKYDCAVKNVDDVAVKEVYFNGVKIDKPALKELDIDAAIETCKQEYKITDDSAGIFNNTQITKFGNNIKDARQGMIESTRGAYSGLHADVMDKATVRHFYSAMPEAIKKAMGDLDARLENPAWFSETVFNTANLGSTASRRQIQTAAPLHLLATYKNVTERVLTKQQTRFKYLDMVLNSEMRLNVGVWADSANDAQILKYFKDHPEITVGILQKPAKGSNMPTLKRVAINTVKDLNNARRVGAIVFSGETYSRAATVLNNSAYDTGFLRILSNVMRVYKIGQLLTLGFLGRNFIDSTFKAYTATGSAVNTLEALCSTRKTYKAYKNALYGMLATSDLKLEVIENIARAFGVSPQDVLNDIGLEVGKFKIRAIKDVINADVLFNKYKTVVEDIIKMDSNAVLRSENVEFYFKYMSDGTELDLDTFYEVHRFITQGASAGVPAVLQRAFLKTSNQTVQNFVDDKQYTKAYQEFAEARHLEGVSDTLVYALGKLSSVNGHVEQVIRLAQHMQQIRSGMNFAESNWKIAKTHFDYADKTDITKSIELIFPYYNFKMNNFEFWAKLMETQPWLLRVGSEFMEQVYDFDSYDTYAEHLELANNESLQYQIFAGNIPIFDTGAVLKVNPSYTDVLNLITGPLGTAESSLFAPLNAGFKTSMLELYKQGQTNEFINNTFNLSDYAYEHQTSFKQQFLNNLPLIGPAIQRFTQQALKYKDRTDFVLAAYLPSLIGATSRWNPESMSKIKSPEEWEALKKGWLNNIIAKQIQYNLKNKYWHNYGYNYNHNYARGYRKAYAKKTYAKKAYAKKTYAKKTYVKKTYAKKTYFKPTSYNKRYNSYARGNRYYSYYNPSYSKYVDYYNKPYVGRYNEHSFANKTKVSRPKKVYPENIYWKYYTKAGKKRWSILSAKATKKNLQMKIKLMYDYYR